jgi:hypothetical protein
VQFPSTVVHRVHDTIRQFVAIVHLGQLREHAFERGLAHQLAKPLNRIVCHNLAVPQDQNRRADLLHNLQHVRTVEDDLPSPRQLA